MTFMKNGRPYIETRLTRMSSEDCKTIASNASAWFGRSEFTEHLHRACDKTLEFLKQNKNYYDEKHKEQSGPWIDINIPFTEDAARLDLRRSIMRTKAFSEGVFYLLKCLNEVNQLPDGAFWYADMCRELAEFAIHEHLMAAQYAKEAAEEDEKILKLVAKSNISLSDLRIWYLYSDSAKLEFLRVIVARMASCGLWDAVEKKKEGLPWTITAGPVAVQFHKDVFFPVVEHFHDLMKGTL